MAQYKDRVPLPPVNAQKTNLTCHFCIVGCGYHVYKWDENREGGRAPNQNALGVDLPQAGATAHADHDAGDAQRHRGRRRQPLQHHDRSGQRLHGQSRPVVGAWRADGDVHVYARGRCQGSPEAAALVRGRAVGRHHLGRGARDLLRRRQESSRQGRSVRARLQLLRPRRRRRAASRTPGARAS